MHFRCIGQEVGRLQANFLIVVVRGKHQLGPRGRGGR